MRIYSRVNKNREVVTGRELIQLAVREMPKGSDRRMIYLGLMNGFSCGVEEFLCGQGRRRFVIDKVRKPEDWAAGGTITKTKGWIKVWSPQ